MAPAAERIQRVFDYPLLVRQERRLRGTIMTVKQRLFVAQGHPKQDSARPVPDSCVDSSLSIKIVATVTTRLKP